MRVHYSASSYLSQHRGARDHARAVAPHVTLVDSPKDADVCVFHADIGNVENELNEIERLGRGRKLVGFVVWEANDLPEFTRPHMKRFDEIWTASRFCHRAFSRHHERVFVVPHLVEPNPFTPQDARFVDRLLPKRDGDVRFLFITTADAKRKNAAQLVEVFSRLRVEMPNAHLIIKGYNIAGEVEEARFATVVPEFLSDAQMAALMASADVYFSPHHSEGWGLNISDAMAQGRLAVATAHSGNLDFMDENNSLLIPCTVGQIGDRQKATQLFAPEMEWANIADDDMANAMRTAYAMVLDGRAKVIGERARVSMQRFGREPLGRLIAERLAALA